MSKIRPVHMGAAASCTQSLGPFKAHLATPLGPHCASMSVSCVRELGGLLGEIRDEVYETRKESAALARHLGVTAAVLTDATLRATRPLTDDRVGLTPTQLHAIAYLARMRGLHRAERLYLQLAAPAPLVAAS